MIVLDNAPNVDIVHFGLVNKSPFGLSALTVWLHYVTATQPHSG